MRLSHRIRIMGRELQVKTDAPAEVVSEIESFVNARLAESESLVSGADSQLTAIIALMNVAELYLSSVRAREAAGREATEKVVGMIRRLEQCLDCQGLAPLGGLDI